MAPTAVKRQQGRLTDPEQGHLDQFTDPPPVDNGGDNSSDEEECGRPLHCSLITLCKPVHRYVLGIHGGA